MKDITKRLEAKLRPGKPSNKPSSTNFIRARKQTAVAGPSETVQSVSAPQAPTSTSPFIAPFTARPESPTSLQGIDILETSRKSTSSPIQQSQSSVISPSLNAGSAHRRPQTKVSTAEMGWNSFRLALGLLKESSTFFPPLHSAVGTLLKVIQVEEQASSNKESFTAMNERIERLARVVKAYESSPVPKYIQDTVDALSQSIERHAQFLEKRMNRTRVQRYLEAPDDPDDIIKSLREITFAIDLFQVDIAMKNEAQGRLIQKIVSDLHELELLKKLDAVDEARYDGRPRTRCMDGTRVDTLTRLLAWAENSTSPRIFWLNGMAGIGKSAIAHSFCQIIDDGRLGASFFCSRQSESLNKVNRILPMIAHQLAHRSDAYRRALTEVLKQTSRNSYASATLQEQAERLFIGIKGSLEGHHLVVVVDALDECTGISDARDLLRVLLHFDLPVKFLITSRPETYLGRAFSSQEEFDIDTELIIRWGFRPKLLDHALLRLHDIEQDIVKEDIARYLANKLSAVLERTNKENMEKNLSALVKKSGNLFLFAFTVVEYLSPRDSTNLSSEDVEERLSIILQSRGVTSALSTEAIDRLYEQIFTSAYQRKAKSEIDRLRASLDTLLCLCKPQPVSVIATLLGRRPGDVRAHLANFTSVLSISEGDDEPVFTFHASFPDYALDSERSKEYALDSRERHQHLALACLRLMNSSLHENMCRIERRQILNADIGKSVISLRVSPALHYACVYWALHLTEGAGADVVDPMIVEELQTFVDVHLLHWLECLSLIQELYVAYDRIQKASSYLNKSLIGADFSEMQSILIDAEFMIPQTYYFIKLHALEVYFSALVWLPSESRLRAKYAQRQIPHVVCGLDRHWDPCLQVLQTKAPVNEIALSPNGIELACAAEFDIQIWNLETGELVKVYTSSSVINSIAFSQDGSRAVSGSDDGILQIWSVETGKAAHQLSAHTDVIRSVTFSSDGSKLASGSDDKVILVWDAISGSLVQRLVGHRRYIRSVALSQDGSKLASGSDDETVLIWNVGTGKLIHQLINHTDWVRSVAFSQDDTKLASGSSDQTICIWDANTGELIQQLVGHTSSVRSVTFSQDGTRLVSGSDDETVLIWDVITGALIQQLTGHTDWVTSVIFSHNSLKLASGSYDKTVRIWNTRELIHQPNSHVDSIESVAFSQGGSRLTSISGNDAVKIWDTATGELVEELQYHAGLPTLLLESGSGHTPWSIHEPAMGQRCITLSNAGTQNPECWIWGSYLPITASAFTPTTACFGYRTGKVVILELLSE